MAKLKLALGGLVLENVRVPGIRVEHEVVDWVLLAGTTEQILVDLSIGATQTAVELPVGDSPSINEANGVRTDLVEQLHDGGGAGEGDLADSHGARGEELSSLTLKSVQSVKTEEGVEKGLGVGVNRLGQVGSGDGIVEVLDNKVL